MWSKEEIKSIKVVGDSDLSNDILTKLEIFFYSDKGNFYSFLLNLDEKVLEKLAETAEYEKLPDELEDYGQLCVSLSIMAYGHQKQREGKDSFVSDMTELVDNANALRIMCSLASLEKKGYNKIIDKSLFWEPKGKLQIEVKQKAFDYIGK